MRILAFAASLRKGSYNKMLIGQAAEAASRMGAEVDLADFAAFDMPLYNQDVQDEAGFPAGALEFARRLNEADAFMISTPEYNYSIPGTLKNAIDWISRMKPMPLKGKPGLILAASGGTVGGARVLSAIQPIFQSNQAILAPGMFMLPFAHKAFDEHGKFTDPEVAKRLDATVSAFLEFASRFQRD